VSDIRHAWQTLIDHTNTDVLTDLYRLIEKRVSGPLKDMFDEAVGERKEMPCAKIYVFKKALAYNRHHKGAAIAPIKILFDDGQFSLAYEVELGEGSRLVCDKNVTNWDGNSDRPAVYIESSNFNIVSGQIENIPVDCFKDIDET